MICILISVTSCQKSTGCNGQDHDYKPTFKLMLKALSMKIELYNSPK